MTLPDDLIDQLTRDYMARTGCRRREVCVLCRDVVRNVLTVLASWSDGALIDPDGWRRVGAKVAHRWHHAYGPDGAVLCNHPDTDLCSDPDRGEWTDYLYTLTPKET